MIVATAFLRMYFHRVSSRHWPSPFTHQDAARITQGLLLTSSRMAKSQTEARRRGGGGVRRIGIPPADRRLLGRSSRRPRLHKLKCNRFRVIQGSEHFINYLRMRAQLTRLPETPRGCCAVDSSSEHRSSSWHALCRHPKRAPARGGRARKGGTRTHTRCV